LAPAPFHHRVQTFPVKLVDGCIYVSPVAYPLGTDTEPLPVPGQKGRAAPSSAHMTLERGVVSAQRPGMRPAPVTPLRPAAASGDGQGTGRTPREAN
jgi:hypothetical protein